MHVRKMHCCGNNFCMIEDFGLRDYGDLAVKICDHRCGIGADGLIVCKENPLELLCYRPDGSRYLMNGNALRCFSKFAFERGYARRGKLEIIMGQDMWESEIITQEPFTCRMNLGKPIYNNSMLSVTDVLDCFGRVIQVGTRYVTIYALYLGTVNTVLFVDDFDAPAVELAEEISKHDIFAKGTNVNFVRVLGKDLIEVKSYEKGLGFTGCSSTGCAASVVVAQKLGYTKTKVKVRLELGVLEIEITKKGTVLITGPAKEVFSCEYEEEK